MPTLLVLGLSALPAFAGPSGFAVSPHLAGHQADFVIRVQMTSPDGPTPGGGAVDPPDTEPSSPDPEPSSPQPSKPEPSKPEPSKPETSIPASSRGATRQSDGPSTTRVTPSPLELALPSLMAPASTDRAIERDLQARKVEDLITQMEAFGYFEGAEDVKARALASLHAISDGSIGAATVMQRMGLALKHIQMEKVAQSVADYRKANPGKDLPEDLKAEKILYDDYKAAINQTLREMYVQAAILQLIEIEKAQGAGAVRNISIPAMILSLDVSRYFGQEGGVYSQSFRQNDMAEVSAIEDAAMAGLKAYRAGTYSNSYLDLVAISPQELALAKVKPSNGFDVTVGPVEN